MSAPRISVLMPAYNATATIGEAVDSVLRQTCKDWELVIVDDGSDDGTSEAVRRFDDPRIRLLEQPRQGVSVARNRAFEASRGELLAFLDADDRFAPEKLAVQAELLDRRPEVGSVYCAHRRVDLAGVPWTLQAPPWEVGFRELLLGFPFNPSAQMVRRSWHERSGGFLPGLEIHEDRDYWLRLSAAGCRFVRAPGVLADYRLGPPKPTAAPQAKARQACAVLERALELERARALSAKEQRLVRAEIFREWGFQAAVSGHPDAASLFAEMTSLTPDLLEPPRRRDEFLQAVVDLSVRARGEHEPLQDAVFAALPAAFEAFQAERNWAAGCGALLRGARELYWDREDAARPSFDRARALGARLDERTSNLLRYDLSQLADALPAGELEAVRARLFPALAAAASQAQVDAFLRSAGAQGPWARAARRVKNWLGGARA